MKAAVAPMFKGGKRSIYRHLPRTCREFDCRVLAATGIRAGADKPLVEKQARRWRFPLRAAKEREAYRAVRAAAKFLRDRPELFPSGFVPVDPVRQAGLAIKAYRVFLGPRRTDRERAEGIVAAAGEDET